MLIPPHDIIYKDFNINFAAHPDTGDLMTLSNENAVKQALKNLVYLQHKDLYQQHKGSNLLHYLFENAADPITASYIKDEIKRVIRNYEKRVNADNLIVNVEDDPDHNGYNVEILFYVIDTSTPVKIDMFLSRVR